VALHHHVGDAGFRFRSPGDGRPARLEQLYLYADRMEEGPGIPCEIAVRNQ